MLKLTFIFFLLLFKTVEAKNHSSPNASVGGTFYFNLTQAPTTLNALTSTDFYASAVHSYVLEGLLKQDPETYEWTPNLAESYTISKDGLVFEFTIRQGVKWHDGKDFTIEDVKFSFDAINDPKFKTAHLKPYLENIEKVEVVNEKVIRFTAKKKYHGNFSALAGGIIQILPKHIYLKNDEKSLNKTLIGTGPYILEKFDRGNHILLKKNDKWWGNKIEDFKGIYNFEKIFMRFVSDENIALEMLAKGQLDFDNLSPEAFVKKTNGDAWGKKVLKVKVQNKAPKGYGFIAWNLDNELFKSKKIRKAMYHLFNRELMIEKFRFGMDVPATGPLYLQSDYASKKVDVVKYDPELALKILKEEGWKDSDNDQILDKEVNGKKLKFSFTILEPNKEFVKYLTVFKEDAKKAGIDVNVKYVEWNTFVKLLDERKFEALRLAWSAGSPEWDPKQIWHSSSREGGSNFINYSNPEVDKLIDQAREIMDSKSRKPVLQKVYELIAEDYPYVFLFNAKESLYARASRMGTVKDTYNYTVGTNYWWITK